MDARLKWMFPTLVFTLVCGLALAAGKETYRWVEASGESIYSPTPPRNPDQPYVMLRDGVVVERFAGLEKPEKPDSEYAEQRRAEEAQRKADQLLTVQFKSEDDIDAAMATELDNLRYDFNLLDGTYESLRKSLFEQIGLAADRQRAGLGVAEHELQQIESIRQRMSANRVARENLNTREQSIRSEYDAKKQRFRVLIDSNSETRS